MATSTSGQITENGRVLDNKTRTPAEEKAMFMQLEWHEWAAEKKKAKKQVSEVDSFDFIFPYIWLFMEVTSYQKLKLLIRWK